MSGNDWLAVLILAGLLALIFIFDRLKELDRRQQEQPCDCWICTTTRQHRATREREANHDR